MKKLLYFGCIKDAGHYLWETQNSRIYSFNIKIPGLNKRVLEHLDSVFTPPDWKPGYLISIVPPVMIVSWWDNSVDKRPGSNSAFIGYGYKSAEQILDDAVKLFPSVMSRQERPKPFILTPTQTN